MPDLIRQGKKRMVSSSDPYLGKQVERHVHVSMCKLRAMNLVSTFLLQATMKATQHNPMTWNAFHLGLGLLGFFVNEKRYIKG